MSHPPPARTTEQPVPCPLDVAAHVRYLVRPSYQSRSADLWGLSRQSAGVVADQPLEPGTPVLLELPGPQPGARELAAPSAAPCLNDVDRNAVPVAPTGESWATTFPTFKRRNCVAWVKAEGRIELFARLATQTSPRAGLVRLAAPIAPCAGAVPPRATRSPHRMTAAPPAPPLGVRAESA
jgi:hypothetical protein